MEMGINTPFLHANCSYKYFNLEEAHEHLKKIGKKIVEVQLPKELCPMIFAITGRGKTAKGCITILQNLPITIISPKEIADLVAHKDDIKHRTTIYLVTINTEDCIEPRDPNAKFDRE